MFDVPFLYGGPWTDEADDSAELVVVITRAFNERLFGGEDSVGRRIFIGRSLYTVVGVLDHWRPIPLFYNILGAGLGTNEPAAIFLPFLQADTNEWRPTAMNSGWKPYEGSGWDAFIASEQTFIQYWAELDTPEQRYAYQDFIDGYALEQKAMGRMPREKLNNQLLDVPTWLHAARQVSGIQSGNGAPPGTRRNATVHLQPASD
jgi:putative ABC transport system permease protein